VQHIAVDAAFPEAHAFAGAALRTLVKAGRNGCPSPAHGAQGE
jgi:hypothetical protein